MLWLCCKLFGEKFGGNKEKQYIRAINELALLLHYYDINARINIDAEISGSQNSSEQVKF